MTEEKYTRDDLDRIGAKWIERIRASEKREESWKSNAEAAERAYVCDNTEGDTPQFNILHSNVETIVPSIYNSTPVPDIRPRNVTKKPEQEPQQQGMPQPPMPQPGMPPMPMGKYEIDKLVSEVYERVITLEIDDNRLDAEIEACAQDAFMAGRGVVRVKFDAEINESPAEGAEGPVAQSVTDEALLFENVSWRDYREGPAKRWRDVPWVAYRHCINREELEKLQNPDYKGDDESAVETSDEDDEDIWEIWCKETGRVYFVVDASGMVLDIKEDPLGLSGFFPQGEPVQPITATGKRTPVCPYTVYKTLAEELDRTTTRINAIMKGLKVRGMISGDAASIEDLAQAEDNTITVVANLENLAATGGLEKAVMWWPIDQAIKVLQQLYLQRDQTKQAIYEITGISDIVRGASSAQETLGAQQIKTQWGSLRIKKMQRLIERQVRDLFVISAEIISQKFSIPTLEKMTGLQIPPEAMAVFNAPLDNYRINVESDSTIRADLSRNRSEMSEFLRGTSEFFGTLAPLVQQNPSAAQPVAEIYGSFARQFNLGKSAEDALEGLVDMAKASAKNPPPNPEAEARKAEMELKAKEMQSAEDAKKAELMLKKQDSEGKLAIDRDRLALDAQVLEFEKGTKRLEVQSKANEAAGTMAAGGDVLNGMVSTAFSGVLEEIRGGNMQLAEMLLQIAKSVSDGNAQIVAAMQAPKELIRDENGRPVGVRSVAGEQRVIN